MINLTSSEVSTIVGGNCSCICQAPPAVTSQNYLSCCFGDFFSANSAAARVGINLGAVLPPAQTKSIGSASDINTCANLCAQMGLRLNSCI